MAVPLSNTIVLSHHALDFHVALSVLTVAILLIAGSLALLLALQERLLRKKTTSIWLQKLPPLKTMETYLFLINRWAFILLTAVLFTSFYLYHGLLWQLAIIPWIVFLVLLLGRHWRGWRGAQAINSTLCGVILVLIAYLAIHTRPL